MDDSHDAATPAPHHRAQRLLPQSSRPLDPLPPRVEGELDAEIEELLEFEPAPRKFKRDNGWTPALQRKFIFHLARTGSSRLAAQALGKDRFGIEKVYKTEGADSFRAAWQRAIEIFEERAAERLEAVHGPLAGIIPPGIDRRRTPSPRPSRGRGEGDWDDDQPGLSEDKKWELIERICTKFMRKVALERQARLAGEIVAADFYLRQITHIEVTLDLLASGFGSDAQEVLRDLRRGGHGVIEIAATEFSDELDAARRAWWRQEGEPERPLWPDVRFLDRHRSAEGDYATGKQMHPAACADPPPGVEAEEWQALTNAGRQALIDGIRARDAEAQREWERRAYEDWERRNGEG